MPHPAQTRRSFTMDDAIALLERTPKTLDSLLRGLPDDWVRSNEGGETWSPFDVIGHLIHGELTDWVPRARIILDHGEGRAFDKFDRFAQLDLSRGRTLDSLLDEFATLRRANLSAAHGTTSDRSRSRPEGAPSRARTGHAVPAPLDLGRARPRSCRPGLANAGATVQRRSRSVACLPARHQRHTGLIESIDIRGLCRSGYMGLSMLLKQVPTGATR